jgi:hypothetical protein
MPGRVKNNFDADRAGTLTSPLMTQHHRWRCVFLAFLPVLDRPVFFDLGEMLAKLVNDYNQQAYLSSRAIPLAEGIAPSRRHALPIF